MTAPVLLFGSLLAITIANLAWSRQISASSVRLAVLRSSIIWAVLLVIITEGLSIFDGLTPRAVGNTWMIVCLLALAVTAAGFYSQRGLNGPFRTCPTSIAEAVFFGIARFRTALCGLTPAWIAFWIFLIVWFGVLLAIAMAAAPNNYDSLTYRLPRIMHWAANASVAHYPTEVIRQLDRTPLAEWMLLHAYLLSGGDRWFNLAQWLAFVGCAVAVYELTARYTTDAKTRVFAVILAVTIPMAVLQATSTQNNIIQAFYFLTFLLFGMKITDTPCREYGQLANAFLCGAALGLAILANAVNMFFCAPFCLWFAWRLRRRVFPLGMACALAGGFLVAGFALRNQELFGHPFGYNGYPPSRDDPRGNREEVVITPRNTRMNPMLFASSLAKNVIAHFATPLQNVNETLHEATWQAHHAAGLKLEEPGVSLQDMEFMLTADRHEDFAGELIQMILILCSLVILPFRRKIVPAELQVVALGLIGGFFLLTLMVVWQTMHPRVEVPLFMAFCPLVALVLPVGQTWLMSGLAGACIAYATPFLVDNHRRPMCGKWSVFITAREKQYFRDFPERFQDYYDVVRLIKKRSYKSVGLQTNEHDLHYPFWPMLRNYTTRSIAIYEVNVSNVSRKLAERSAPDAVLVTSPPFQETLRIGDRVYSKSWSGLSLALYD